MEMKENREKMAALVRMLRRDINGAVVERMEQLGIRYECNWGVSLHAVRRAASLFAPDHAFARFLYGQNLRELLLSAFVIADPLCSLCRRTRFLGSGGEEFRTRREPRFFVALAYVAGPAAGRKVAGGGCSVAAPLQCPVGSFADAR